MLNKCSVSDLDLSGKRVFCRVDFNVPINEDGSVGDDTRIVAALPTIRYIIEQGGRLILASHLGRPKGKKRAEFSLAPVAPHLAKLLGTPVTMAPDCIGPEVEHLTANMGNGDVVLLENMRFYPEEEKNAPEFCAKLAKLADLYVNDAFGTAHRAHASTEGVAHILQPAAAGFLMAKELEYLGKALENPQRPFIAILGGAKVGDKIPVITNLLDKVDTILIGGGMAYTFLHAQGYEVGKSLLELDQIELAGSLLKQAHAKGVEIKLPLDHVVAPEFSNDAPIQNVDNNEFPADCMGLDIGPKTIAAYAAAISHAATIVWNGPMGVFEMENFARGTMEIAHALAQADAITIIGGGDSVAAVNQAGVSEAMTHISTGGGASLELLEGKILPGVASLSDKE
ncbi:MAG: phosphoglycerate kinase [Desulfuromonadaceae bacterium]|nr:phosphoglycerate kinase [Desulfuromonadaceae bacterium]